MNVLTFGDRNKTKILNYQNKLYYLGYYHGSIDGLFGYLTKKAVKRFQKEYGLIQDGIIGLAPDGITGPAIDKAYSSKLEFENSIPKSSVKIIKTGSAERDVIVKYQKMLAELGYYNGELDGIFGPLTKKATEEFQKANQLAIDGIIGFYPIGETGPAIKNAYKLYLSGELEKTPSQLISRIMTEIQKCANSSSDYWYGANAYTAPSLEYLNSLRETHKDIYTESKYKYLFERLSTGKTKLVSDCSGYWWGVMNVKLRDVYGKYVDRTAHSTFSNECIEIKKEQVIPGDMVFLRTESNGKIYHIGYVGLNGLVYEAAGTYYGIVSSPLDNRRLYNNATKKWVNGTPWNIFGRPKIFVEGRS